MNFGKKHQGKIAELASYIANIVIFMDTCITGWWITKDEAI